VFILPIEIGPPSDNYKKLERMKKSSATIFSPAMELPVITRKITRRSKRRKLNRIAEPAFEPLQNVVPPPAAELIEKLNRIGQEYPFCVCFKAKLHDPL
jgi:hypothetical protein